MTPTYPIDASPFVEKILAALGYPGLTALMLLENLFPPLPSELVLPLVGYLIGIGRMQLLPALVASTLGSVLGALALYALARWLGEARLKRLLRRFGSYLGITEAAYDRGAGVLRRKAPAVLFFSRFVPGLRSVISLPAGVAGVPLPVFVLWTALSSLLWNAALITSGVLLGRSWPRIFALVDSYEAVLLWGGAAMLAAFVGYRLLVMTRAGRAGIGAGGPD